MRKFVSILVLLVLCAVPAFAQQETLFRSTSGAEIHMVGTENQQFKILVVYNGQTHVYDGWWTRPHETFSYRNDQGVQYCSYTNKGWSINVQGPGNATPVRWDFVRYISR